MLARCVWAASDDPRTPIRSAGRTIASNRAVMVTCVAGHRVHRRGGSAGGC